MTKEEADVQARIILKEWADEEEAALDKALRDGVIKLQLDGASHITKPIKEKYWKKIQELAAQIDEDE